MLGVDDDYLAFCLDQAIGMLGSGISHELNEVSNDAKTKAREAKLQLKLQKRLSELLNLPETAAQSEKRYRTPTVSK